MRHGYSRLASAEEKRNMRRSTLFVVLTIGTLVLIFTAGIPLLSNFAGFIGDLKKSTTPIDINDHTPPPPPTTGNLPEFTNQQKLEVSGNTEAGATVKLFFNNSEQEVVATEDGKYTFSVMLSKGENNISLTSKDGSGNESPKSTAHVTVYDNESPDLSVSSPGDGAAFFGSKQRQLTVSGVTESGATLTINDRPIKVNEDGTFSYTTTLNEGNTDFNVKAHDKAGNQTEKKVSVSYSP